MVNNRFIRELSSTVNSHLFDGARGPHSDAMLMSDCHAINAALEGK